jgi:hypothetical protein
MNTSRPAFATIAMVILLALVTTALAGFVAVSGGEHRRTQSAIAQAQLREFILAVTIDTNHRAINWGESPQPQQWNLNLPVGVARMNLTVGPSGEPQVVVILGKNRVVQFIRFKKVDSQWQMDAINP